MAQLIFAVALEALFQNRIQRHTAYGWRPDRDRESMRFTGTKLVQDYYNAVALRGYWPKYIG